MSDRFTNRQLIKITDVIKRQLKGHQDYFIYSVLQVLSNRTFYDLFQEGARKKYMLVTASQEVQKPKEGAQIPEDIYKKSVLGNSSYTILRDKTWEYFLINDDEDLNFLRLLLTKGETVVIDLSEVNKKLGG